MTKKLIKIFILLILIAIVISISNNYDYIKNKLLMKIYIIDYSDYVEKYAKEYEVDKYLIYAIIKAESNFNENAVSNKKAKGLMQLMYSTAEEVATQIGISINEEKILEPDTNIKLGTKYISDLLKRYENIGLALAAYNARKRKCR